MRRKRRRDEMRLQQKIIHLWKKKYFYKMKSSESILPV
jgi:hypothetical protein